MTGQFLPSAFLMTFFHSYSYKKITFLFSNIANQNPISYSIRTWTENCVEEDVIRNQMRELKEENKQMKEDNKHMKEVDRALGRTRS